MLIEILLCVTKSFVRPAPPPSFSPKCLPTPLALCNDPLAICILWL